MPETLDPLEKARLRLLKRQKQREQDERLEKDQAARIRKMESDYDHRRAVVMGRLVRDKWNDLLASTRAEISGLLAASELTDSDKVKLARFLPVTVKPNKSAASQSGVDEDVNLVDFVSGSAPTRPKGENLDAAE